jgi:hypothetical protein
LDPPTDNHEDGPPVTTQYAGLPRAFYRDSLGLEIHVEESMNYGLVQPGEITWRAASASRRRPGQRR